MKPSPAEKSNQGKRAFPLLNKPTKLLFSLIIDGSKEKI
jgi:hypothetical protein